VPPKGLREKDPPKRVGNKEEEAKKKRVKKGVKKNPGEIPQKVPHKSLTQVKGKGTKKWEKNPCKKFKLKKEGKVQPRNSAETQ